jgi:uncharacterized protein (TIGR02001 family)
MLIKSSIQMIVISFLVIGSTTLNATPEFSGSTTLLSDYRSDGVSQTQNKPAVQLYFKSNFERSDSSSFYISTFLSNLEYLNDKGTEFDLALGSQFKHQGYTFDIGILNNYATDIQTLDNYFLEAYVGVSFGNKSAYFIYADDKDSFAGGQNAKIIWDQNFNLAPKLKWHYQLGYNNMLRAKAVDPDYFWVSAGITYTYQAYKLSVVFYTTDIDKKDDPSDIAQSNLAVIANYSF